MSRRLAHSYRDEIRPLRQAEPFRNDNGAEARRLLRDLIVMGVAVGFVVYVLLAMWLSGARQ